MSETKSSLISFRLILGLVAIVVGTALVLENLHMLPTEQVFRWWPLILLALAAGKFLDRGLIWSTSGHILLWAGVLGLLGELDHDEIIHRWWPMILIYFGALMAVRSFVPRPPKYCKSGILSESEGAQK